MTLSRRKPWNVSSDNSDVAPLSMVNVPVGEREKLAGLTMPERTCNAKY